MYFRQEVVFMGLCINNYKSYPFEPEADAPVPKTQGLKGGQGRGCVFGALEPRNFCRGARSLKPFLTWCPGEKR